MQIVYHPNPLKSVVLLDEKDKERLRDKLHIELLDDAVDEALDAASKGVTINCARLKKILEPVHSHLDTIIETLDKRMAFATYLLETGEHEGDCCCLPASCGRCQLEKHLGISTIEGFDKYNLNLIRHAFVDKERRERTPEEAFHYLATYKPVIIGDHERAIRARDKASETFSLLKSYQDKHFPASEQKNQAFGSGLVCGAP